MHDIVITMSCLIQAYVMPIRRETKLYSISIFIFTFLHNLVGDTHCVCFSSPSRNSLQILFDQILQIVNKVEHEGMSPKGIVVLLKSMSIYRPPARTCIPSQSQFVEESAAPTVALCWLTAVTNGVLCFTHERLGLASL